MIILLAPSKTLDFEHPAPDWAHSTMPMFQDKAAMIVAKLARMNQHQLATLMHVSDTIASVNHERIAQWGNKTKPAIWSYRGDVYKGIYADTLTKDDVDWAQQHVCIMSGLYGIVRPYDAISPYRLEMKAKLPVGGAKDLYGYWDKDLARYVDEQSSGVICNLSSDEYSRPVTRHSTSRIITPIFFDHRPNGKLGPAPIYNKMMRGVMAYWMIKHQIDSPDRLHEFTGHGYVHDETLSTRDAPAFSRDKMTPLVF